MLAGMIEASGIRKSGIKDVAPIGIAFVSHRTATSAVIPAILNAAGFNPKGNKSGDIENSQAVINKRNPKVIDRYLFIVC